MEAFKSLYRAMSVRRRRHLFATMLLMPIGAIAEMLTVGAALPFLAVLADPDSRFLSPEIRSWFEWLGGSVAVGAAILLIGAAVVAAAARLLLTWTSHTFVMALGHDLATSLFARMLRQPYATYVQRNSSEILAGMEKVQHVVFNILQPVMQGFMAAVIAIFIAALLFTVHPGATAVGAATVVGTYAVMSRLGQKRLRENSRMLAYLSIDRTKTVQEGLGGIRDILLDHSQDVFERKFSRYDSKYRQGQVSNALIGAVPRFVVEAAGVIAIALVALAMSRQTGGIVAAIPTLGALALGAQRLLPLAQQAYLGWAAASGNLRALHDVIALLNAPVVTSRPLAAGAEIAPFRSQIEFSAVSYRHEGGDFGLRDINLRIPRGARIALVGRTGSGKSTLLDVFMGLLEPSEGEIRIDERPLDDSNRAEWQAQIAHVPQFIYLVDDTIAANIAFGQPEDRIDLARVQAAARIASVDAFITSLPAGYDTRIGERGIRLSGGQRQRIGIARALYKQAPVLVLDEATSALDEASEAAVMAGIANMEEGITMIVVSHRRSSLHACTQTVRLEEGQIVGQHDGAPTEFIEERAND